MGYQQATSCYYWWFHNKVYSSKIDIMRALKDIGQIIEQREFEISEHIKNENEEFSLTAKDIGLKPIIIYFDEVSAIVSSLDSKEKKEFDSYLTQIVQLGRSLGICLVIGLQNAHSETIKTAVRNQFSFRVLLGNSTSEDIQFLFGNNKDTIEKTVPIRTGYFTLDSVTINPQVLYITDLYKNKFNKIKYLKKIQNIV